MRTVYILILVLLSFPLLVQATNNLPEYSNVYDENRDPFKDSETAIALAKETNRLVLMVVGGNWCSFCKKMDTFIQSTPEVSTALYENFVILKINMSEENKNDTFLKSLPPITSYPHVFISTGSGKILFSKNTLNLQVEGVHIKEKWLEFIKKWHPK